MRYDLLINTGSSNIETIKLSIRKPCVKTFFDGTSFAMDSRVTGRNMTLVELNSQTLCETDAVSSVIGFGSVYTTSGDFYTNSSYGPRVGFIEESLPVGEILYENRSGAVTPFFSSTGTGSFDTGIKNRITGLRQSDSGLLNQYAYFLNGQLLASGVDMNVSATGVNYSGDATGRMMAVRIDSGLYLRGGSEPDATDVFFIRGYLGEYVNGMRQNGLWLQTYNPTFIYQGVQAVVDVYGNFSTGILL